MFAVGWWIFVLVSIVLALSEGEFRERRPVFGEDGLYTGDWEKFGFQWDLFLRAMAIWILSPLVVAGLWKLCVWFRRIQKIEPTEDTK